jgi:outer membrane murein-binding lipoprotein Lpp
LGVLVCGSCARDIAVPESLIAERDELARKRDAVRDELAAAKDELNRLKRARKRRSA